MRKTSLAKAKAHFSELVDEVEHHGRRILILRHGKPAAAIVPVGIAVPRREPMTDGEIERLWSQFGPRKGRGSAVRDLAASRSRLDD